MKNCNQCGKCCIKYGNGGLSASEDDITFWETFRPTIFAYVKNGDIWVDPKTGENLQGCPWLQKVEGEEKYSCAIYFDRPEDCRHYPTSLNEMVRDECEMLELSDLKNTQRAQKRLDVLMLDSRPPFGGG